jgi:hypothetical protein
VMGLEMGEGGDGGEALAPETAEQLINFIGMSLQIFGVILQSPKADPKLLQVAQILTAQAPGLIAKVQEITMSEEDEDEDEDYEDEDYEDGDEDSEDSEVEDEPGAEPTEVLEPRKREPVQAVPEQPEAPKAETAAPAEASVSVEKPAEVTPVEARKGRRARTGARGASAGRGASDAGERVGAAARRRKGAQRWLNPKR